MLRAEIMRLIVEDIQNTVDGAGSDLEFVGDELYDGTWLDVMGALDIYALAGTLQYAFEQHEA